MVKVMRKLLRTWEREGAPFHGIPSKAIPNAHVEEERSKFVHIQPAHKRKAVDGLCSRDWHRVDEGDERQATAKGELDHGCAGKESLGVDLDLRHLHSQPCWQVALK